MNTIEKLRVVEGMLRRDADELAALIAEAKKESAKEASANPLKKYGIAWVARDGTVHNWPCEEHKGAVIYPIGFPPIPPIIQTGADNGQVIVHESGARKEQQPTREQQREKVVAAILNQGLKSAVVAVMPRRDVEQLADAVLAALPVDAEVERK